MTKHNRYTQHHNRPPPSSPLQVPISQLFGDGNEQWSSYNEGAEMQTSFSQHSWESAWDSSPQSYGSPYLNGHYLAQSGLNASPVTPPAMSFDNSPSFGTWVEEPGLENLPLLFSEQDFAYDNQNMFRSPAGMSYPQDENVLAGSYGSRGGYEAPIEATQEAPSSTKSGWHCVVPGCPSETCFTRKTDLHRHVKSVHDRVKFDCEYPWCGRIGENGFVRKDHYLEHLREMHRKDIPKVNRRRSNH